MKLTRYEKFMLYILGFLDCVETVFVKYFRSGSLACILLYAYGLAGGLDQGNICFADIIPLILPFLSVLGVLALIYKILVYKNRIRSSKRKNVNRNH
jgi:hypothetical protein